MKYLFKIQKKQVRTFLETLTIDQKFFIYELLTDMDKDDAFEMVKIFSNALDYNKSDSQKIGELEDELYGLASEGKTDTQLFKSKLAEVDNLKKKMSIKENVFYPKKGNVTINFTEDRDTKSMTLEEVELEIKKIRNGGVE